MRLSGATSAFPLDHRPLDFNGAVHRVDDAAENSMMLPSPVCSKLTPMVDRDGRIDQVAAAGVPEPRQNPVLVGSGKPH